MVYGQWADPMPPAQAAPSTALATTAANTLHSSNVNTRSWKPEQLLVSGGEGKPSIDIMPYLKDPSDPDAAIASLFRKALLFPPDVYPPYWKDKKVIEQALKKGARDAGFELLSQGNEAPQRNGHRATKWCCEQGRAYSFNARTATDFQKRAFLPMQPGETRSQKEGLRSDHFHARDKLSRGNSGRGVAKGAERAFTTKPSKENRCSFQIRLLLDPGNNWYLKSGYGCAVHCCDKIAPAEKRRRIATLDGDEFKTAGIIAKNSTEGQAGNSLFDLHGINFSNSQIWNLRKKYNVQSGRVVLPAILTGDGSEESDASVLIRQLTKECEEGKKNFIAYYTDIRDTDLLTVRATDLRRDRLRRTEESKLASLKESAKDSAKVICPSATEKTADDDACVEMEMEATSSTGVVTRSKAKMTRSEQKELAIALQPIHNRLKVGQRILLAVAWVREDEKRLFELYPEILSIDVTYGTNSEGRPLAMTGCLDSDCKVFCPIRAFLPSECKWVFRWLWAEAIPSLLGSENCQRIHLVLSDGDAKIYEPFGQLKEKFYPNAQHGLCLYHLVVQQMEDLNIMNIDDARVNDVLHT